MGKSGIYFAEVRMGPAQDRQAQARSLSGGAVRFAVATGQQKPISERLPG
jgi:hypothetical protein